MTAPAVALALPPLTQLNTPYPGTAYLARFLRDQGVACTQRDLGLDLVLRTFSRDGLRAIFDTIEHALDTRTPLPGAPDGLPEAAWEALARRDAFEDAVDPVISFLQGRDRTLAARIQAGGFLPAAPRSAAVDLSDFGSAGIQDGARRLATAWLADLADLVACTVDPGFRLASYQHHLAVGPVRFDPIAARLRQTTLLDAWLDEAVDAWLDSLPGLQVLGMSLPFPGTLYGALRIGRRARARGLTVVLGGGYVSTELREVDEARLWDCVDALVYDDGEGPLAALLRWIDGGPDRRHRTRTSEGMHDHPAPRPPSLPVAWYGDLDLSRYLQLVDARNPAQRLWGDGRWNKLTLAHGCYWRRCAFCDIDLDYIARFAPSPVPRLVEAIEELVEVTGQRGFHLVDEAAPPRLLKELALTLLARRIDIAWWGNIRFEPAFTPDLCALLAQAGLIMVTGGLEVASDRLLNLMDKGIRVEQAARTARAFRDAGVRVHAYLMYGFPTQTDQESVDAMEVVRQLFAEGALDSAFWHRFVLTRHSGVHRDPDRFSIRIPPVEEGLFATNDLPHEDPLGGDPDRFDAPLVASLSAWMAGRDLHRPVQTWLPPGLPAPTEAPDRIARALRQPAPRRGRRLLWLGEGLLETDDVLVLLGRRRRVELRGTADQRQWLAEVVDAARPAAPPLLRREAEAVFPGSAGQLRALLDGARPAGLVCV